MDLARRSLPAGMLLALFGACSSTPPVAPGWRSFEFAVGPQDLDEESWAPLDARVRGALTWSAREPQWPCGIEFGFQYARSESQEESVTAGADFFDIRVGAAMEWHPLEWLTLVGGAGPRLGFVSVTLPGTYMPVDEDEASVGLYAHAGAFVRVYRSFSVGLEGQWADGTDYDVMGAPRDAASAELLIALRWGI